METPPLARRKPHFRQVDTPDNRNTSACAEKTFEPFRPFRFRWKHLRLRGENRLSPLMSLSVLETPPLARRKRELYTPNDRLGGNTSACAEKTKPLAGWNVGDQKHLRLRGENCNKPKIIFSAIETPPLARRKLFKKFPISRSDRNTSACAEKTTTTTLLCLERKKHLRLRGENKKSRVKYGSMVETPPLARRKLFSSAWQIAGFGNTSACAEKTIFFALKMCVTEKHLRLRGENLAISSARLAYSETPPLARRKPMPCRQTPSG